MPWATTDEVVEITGIAVTGEQLTRAQFTIELFVGRTEDATPNFTAMTKAWLKRAVAYQAAWMADPSNAGIFSQKEVTRLSQDGASLDFRPDAQLLSPFAKRALKKLGWKGTRSIYTPASVPGGRHYQHAEGVVGVHDFPDDPWRPL